MKEGRDYLLLVGTNIEVTGEVARQCDMEGTCFGQELVGSPWVDSPIDPFTLLLKKAS
jgi:hypothetical protein